MEVGQSTETATTSAGGCAEGDGDAALLPQGRRAVSELHGHAVGVGVTSRAYCSDVRIHVV